MTNSALAVRKCCYLCAKEFFTDELADLNIWEITR